MANTPNVQAPIWAATESSPWLMSGKRARIFDAFCTRSIIESRASVSPPGACADGARYLVAAGATGLWAGLDGQLVIAVGTNAANGWYAVPVAVKGSELYVRDENIEIRHNGAAWITISTATPIFRLQDLLDVSLGGMADGNVLKWDASNGVFYPATDLQSIGSATTESIIIAASDESTALTTGDKVTFRMPYPFALTGVKCSLTTAQASGSIFTADVKKGGSTIFSTKPTIDNTEKTTATAAAPSALSTTALADDDEMIVNVNQIGDGTAKGLKVVLIGHQ